MFEIEKMREGRFSIFVIEGESPSNLRVAEVLKKDEGLVLCRQDYEDLRQRRDDARIETSGARMV